MVLVLVVLGAVAAAAASLFVYKRKTRTAEQQLIADKRKGVRRAKSSVKSAEKTFKRGINAARADLAQADRGATVESHGMGFVLREFGLETPDGWISLLGGGQATVDADVRSRLTVTRMVTLGVFSLAAPKKTGEIYLTVETDETAGAWMFKAQDRPSLTRFAAAITRQGKQGKTLTAKRNQWVASARETLEERKAATGPIENSNEGLKVAERELSEAIAAESSV